MGEREQDQPSSGTQPEAHLELEELLGQVIDRAQEFLRSQNRLHGLLRATREIASDLSLPVLLGTIVNVARDLVEAEYAALGVLNNDGRLVQFVHAGMDQETVERIGPLPAGRGVLGLLMSDPRPIRIAELSDHPRAVGFPAHHPPMHSFLGVPIRIRDRVFGNLYLTEKSGDGEFTREDEELATALAAAAAAAIDNSRLFETVRRREHWLDASRRITNALLGLADQRQALAIVAEGARTAALADAAVVLVANPDTPRAFVVDAVDALEDFPDRLPAAIAIDASVCAQAYRSAKPLVFDDIAGEHPDDALLSEGAAIGPAMVVPLAPAGAVRGLLIVANRSGGSLFSQEDLDMATDFADQAALVLNIASTQVEAKRAEMLEERARIARDLHDQVIQRLFATGLGLQALASDEEPGPQARQLLRHVNDLDATIKDIRSTIFALRRDPEEHDRGFRARVLQLVEEQSAASELFPKVRFEGPLDSVVPTSVAQETLAVLREALANVLKHAQATTIQVEVSVSADRLVLTVQDDGVGIPDNVERRGLRYMQERAERLGGESRVVTAPGQGTTITWSALVK